MEIGTRAAGAGRVVLTPVGDLDMAGVPRLGRALGAVLDGPGLVEIEVDLGGVGFLDSTGVAALLQGAAEAVGRGASLRVSNPRPLVARVLRITSVDGLLGLAVDPDDGEGSAAGRGWRRLG